MDVTDLQSFLQVTKNKWCTHLTLYSYKNIKMFEKGETYHQTTHEPIKVILNGKRNHKNAKQITINE